MSYSNPMEIRITLCDHLNPGFGYQVEINRRHKGLFFGSIDPETGNDLQSLADCLRIVTSFATKEELAEIGSVVTELMVNTIANS